MTTAEQILAQLGGSRRLSVMTGAKNFIAKNSGKTLMFKIPQAKDGINTIQITLDETDTYTMEFGRVAKSRKTGSLEYGEKATVSNIYADMLQREFSRATGLATQI